ncbi:hypothetical protein [Nocardia brasiliensis]|uniref:hypothetical protein n=1 Tax=Nocardia brasiliensis TaxID=37326 RepID=UPI0018937B24|nr:hypothetical protein [Nocardia brasiliensis]MBF6547277.1 hypothetical protein [Nocardia brasiliensis]
MAMVRRFWIEFELPERPDSVFMQLRDGVGVTGFDERDCLSMAADLVYDGSPLPPVRRVIADISLAEPLPVRPYALGVPVWRGVWFPPKNLETGAIWRSPDFDRLRELGASSVEPSPPMRASDTLRTKNLWWNDIPQIDNLLWPIVYVHYAACADMSGRFAAGVRDNIAASPAYGSRVREALDYIIERGTTPDEWCDPTGVVFADRAELAAYLTDYRDYLFGGQPEPEYLSGVQQLPQAPPEE